MKKISETNISNNKNSEQDISHEVKPVNTSKSQENIENNYIEREKDIILQSQEISPEKNFTQGSTEKHTRANNSKISVNKKYVRILGDQIAKWLGNGEENTI